jgi:hypothetical protein
LDSLVQPAQKKLHFEFVLVSRNAIHHQVSLAQAFQTNKPALFPQLPQVLPLENPVGKGSQIAYDLTLQRRETVKAVFSMISAARLVS